MMKYLLGTVFAALLLAPLAFTSNADQGKSNGSAIAHCGSCDKDKKCKEGCDCKKCKKKAGEKDKEEALLAHCGSCDKGKKCKEGCDCKKCKKKAGEKDKEEALLAQCKGCGKKKKGADKAEEALLFAV